MNNMKLSSRAQFPWNTIFGPDEDLLAAMIVGLKTAYVRNEKE